jgi:hypothetical protein
MKFYSVSHSGEVRGAGVPPLRGGGPPPPPPPPPPSAPPAPKSPSILHCISNCYIQVHLIKNAHYFFTDCMHHVIFDFYEK